MITIDNYHSEITKFDLSKLPDTLREGHEFLLESLEFYGEDKDIRETLDLYLEKLNEYQAFKKGNKQPIIRDFYAQLSQTEKVNLRRGILSPAKQKLAEKLNLSIEEVVAFDQGIKPSFKQTTTKSAKRETKKAEPVTAKGKRVEVLREEVKLIKRFIGFHDKPKELSAILNLIKTLQRAIVLKLIKKTSPFAEDIRYIQERLVKLYNSSGNNGTVRITINENDLARYVGIVGGETVYKSIGIIKRFIGMQGKEVEKSKTESFLKAIKTANLDPEDPYFAKVQAIVDYLKKSGKGIVKVSEQELSGLKGILKGCCTKGFGKIYDTSDKELRKCKSKKYSDAGKGACSSHQGLVKPKGSPLNGIMTAEQVSRMRYEKLPFDGKWGELVGQPATNFDMMIFGQPGSGKTTFLLSFAHYLATSFGSVLYVSGEEYNSAPLTDKTNQLPSIPANLHFAKDVRNLSLKDYRFVILDSITDLGIDLEAYKSLREKYPSTAFILILQTTKDGKFKGGKEWEHEMEIAGVVDNGVISVYKNRYGIKGQLNFFMS